MWRKSNGFFLIELLLSLSAWLVIAGILFPLIIHAVNQSIQLRQDYEGTQVLYEVLQKASKNGSQPVNETIKIDRTVYEIRKEEAGDRMEVCVSYEDILKKTYEKCDLLQ